MLDSATPVLSTQVEKEEKDFNPRKGHWVSIFGFETLKYEVPFEFNGEQQTFKKDQRELWGGRLGFGREFYLGAGFMTSTRLEGFYVGTLFERQVNAGPEETSIKLAHTKKTGQVYGVEAVQSLSFLFDMKTKNPFLDEWTYLTVEPFIEAGLGRAKAYNRLNYHYDVAGVREDYRSSVEDEIVNNRIGAGVNFTSNTGYFLYIRATQNRYDVTNRKFKKHSKPNNQALSTEDSSIKNVDMDPVTIYALGGGYKF